MFFELSLFALLLFAIATGWALAKFQAKGISVFSRSKKKPKGIDFDAENLKDTAIENFIHSLDVNSDTFEFHISLGHLLREKGEVDRATVIHQNLLNYPDLGADFIAHAQFELAKDYIAVGLIEKAEPLLEGLLTPDSNCQEAALRCLLDVYQQQQEWAKAIRAGRKLLPKRFAQKLLFKVGKGTTDEKRLRLSLAHFYCEKAELYLSDNKLDEAKRALRSARAMNKNCIRAMIQQAELELADQAPDKALKIIGELKSICPDMLVLVLPVVNECHKQLEDDDRYLALLEQMADTASSPHLSIAYMAELKKQKGGAEAELFLLKKLSDCPSLRLLGELPQYLPAESLDDLPELPLLNQYGQTIEQVLDEYLQHKPSYQCHSCGFSGKQMHWKCPSCQDWDTIRPITGIAGY